MSLKRYKTYLYRKEKEFEALCTRCGECCGALDDPCVNLAKAKDGKYFCKEYDNRLGQQKTIKGYPFMCVSIREHISNDTLREKCAYRKS